MVPLSVPRSPLPNHILVDSKSPWQVSGLFATGMETATIESRIRSTGKIAHGSLGDLVDSLNVAGRQTISMLDMTVMADHYYDNDSGGQIPTPPRAYSNDIEAGKLDINFLNTTPNIMHPRHRKNQIFSQVTTQRQTEIHERTIPYESAIDASGGMSALTLRRKHLYVHTFTQRTMFYYQMQDKEG
jgi:hypothetical protein